MLKPGKSAKFSGSKWDFNQSLVMEDSKKKKVFVVFSLWIPIVRNFFHCKNTVQVVNSSVLKYKKQNKKLFVNVWMLHHLVFRLHSLLKQKSSFPVTNSLSYCMFPSLFFSPFFSVWKYYIWLHTLRNKFSESFTVFFKGRKNIHLKWDVCVCAR